MSCILYLTTHIASVRVTRDAIASNFCKKKKNGMIHGPKEKGPIFTIKPFDREVPNFFFFYFDVIFLFHVQIRILHIVFLFILTRWCAVSSVLLLYALFFFMTKKEVFQKYQLDYYFYEKGDSISRGVKKRHMFNVIHKMAL